MRFRKRLEFVEAWAASLLLDSETAAWPEAVRDSGAVERSSDQKSLTVWWDRAGSPQAYSVGSRGTWIVRHDQGNRGKGFTVLSTPEMHARYEPTDEPTDDQETAPSAADLPSQESWVPQPGDVVSWDAPVDDLPRGIGKRVAVRGTVQESPGDLAGTGLYWVEVGIGDWTKKSGIRKSLVHRNHLRLVSRPEPGEIHASLTPADEVAAEVEDAVELAVSALRARVGDHGVVVLMVCRPISGRDVTSLVCSGPSMTARGLLEFGGRALLRQLDGDK